MYFVELICSKAELGEVATSLKCSALVFLECAKARFVMLPLRPQGDCIEPQKISFLNSTDNNGQQ